MRTAINHISGQKLARTYNTNTKIFCAQNTLNI